MREIRTNSKIERIVTSVGLGFAGGAFLIMGAATGFLAAGLVPVILGTGFLAVMVMYLSNTTKEGLEGAF